jgi:glycosyltransferase involved in cell wall biosynthesis
MFALDSFNSQAGTENQLIELIRGMDSRRFELFTACVEDALPPRRLAALATPMVFPMTRVFSFNGFRQVLRLRSHINRMQIDIVHTFMVRATILGVLAARGSSCKVILTSRRNLGYWYTPFYLNVFRILNRMTSRVVANSEAAKRAAIEIEDLQGSRIDVLYNGVQLARFSGSGDPSLLDRLGIPRPSRIIGIVANYRSVKDLPMFLRAASRIASRHPDALFLLVGQGPLRQSLETLTEQLGIREKVFFTDGEGPVPGYLPLLYIGCLTSLNEGFSNAILEYMAAGLAVVATDVGGNREAVVDGVTGFLTPVGDENIFAQRVISLLEDDDLRKTMGECGRARCAEHFSMEACVREHEKYYESLLQGDRT